MDSPGGASTRLTEKVARRLKHLIWKAGVSAFALLLCVNVARAQAVDAPAATATDTLAATSTMLIPGATGTAPTAKRPPRLEEIIRLKGFWYTKWRESRASGNSMRFESGSGLSSYGNKIEQGSSITVEASVGKSFTLDGSVYDMPYQERQMKFGLRAGNLKATLGDFTATLDGGAYANFSKKITGAMLEYTTNNYGATIITSQPRSATKTETFRGRNIKGPYDLKGVDLIAEKVQVKKNGEVVSAGSYILEPYQGDITFDEIITPDDIITVTYEQAFQIALDTGSITGFSGWYKARSGKWETQIARLQQESGRSAQSGIQSVTDEPHTGQEIVNSRVDMGGGVYQYRLTLTSVGINVDPSQSRLIVRFGGTMTTTESITKNGAALVSGVDYNVIAPDGIDSGTMVSRGTELRNKAYGIFVLRDPPAATDTFSMSFSYYPASSIHLFTDEVVPVELNGTAFLPNRTVYYGSELLYGCPNSDGTNCDPAPLARESETNGYIIDEMTNTIYLRGAAAGFPYIKAVYYTYPAFLPSGSLYDKSVTSLTTKYTPSAKLNFKLDFARSESDISGKPIDVFAQVVATVQADTQCPSNAAPNPCLLPLGRTDISPESDRVYFNDVSSRNSAKVRHTDYRIDYDTGTISLIKSVPAGTVILADYSYTPPNIGIQEGRIFKLSSSYTGKKLSLTLDEHHGDTFFSQIGGESNFDTGSRAINGAYTFSEGLKFNFSTFDQETAVDVLGMNHQFNSRRRYAVDYSSARISSLKLFTSERTMSDDYAAPRTDMKETSNGMALRFMVPWVKNLDFGITRQSDKSASGPVANASPGSRTDTQNIQLAYRLGKLDLNSAFGRTRRDTADYNGSTFSVTTKTRNIGLKYDFSFFRLTADVNRQQSGDSRPDGERSVVNNTRMSASTRPFWRIESFTINHTRSDRPSINTPSTSSTTTSYSAPVRISPDLQMAANHTTANSSVGGSNSKNTNTSWKFDYRPPGKPWNASFSISDNKTKSASASSSISTKSARKDLLVAWRPNDKWGYNVGFMTENTASGASGKYGSNVLTFATRFEPSERKSYSFQYNLTKRKGDLPEQFRTINFTLAYKISKLLDWNFGWKRNVYRNSRLSRENYSGDLMETELRANF